MNKQITKLKLSHQTIPKFFTLMIKPHQREKDNKVKLANLFKNRGDRRLCKDYAKIMQRLQFDYK